MKPQDVDELSMVFGGNMAKLLPPRTDIPEEFYYSRTPWNKVFSKWFFGALPANTKFRAKDGIDAQKASRHLAAIMRSFEPKHEHKEGAVAWLMSQWFSDIVADGRSLVTGEEVAQ